MTMLNREAIQRIKEKCSPGTRIKLISMEDPYSPIPASQRALLP